MEPILRICPRCHTPLTEIVGGRVCAVCLLEQTLADGEEPGSPDGGDVFPRSFGDYELLSEVGRGGMGLVFKARQLSLSRLVALKVLLYGTFGDKAVRRRFHAEAESAARLQHPNIVAIHEVGEQDGVPYFTMDLVDGPDLGRLCNGRPLPTPTAARYVGDIARAVQAAHDAGVLHRDLKPSNILVGSDGRPRVTDFGLAKLDDTSASLGLTAVGQILGSPSYASPEQAAGRLQDVAAPSDIYGLGAILYHLITGRAPFVAATATQTLRLVLDAEPVPPRLLNPGLPRDLETICLKCLQKEPIRRYATAAMVADDLKRYLDNRPIIARPVSLLHRMWRWCRRHPAVASLMVTLFLVLSTATEIAALQARRTEHARLLAEQARNAAVVSRGEAERLVTWMLDDLCTNIESSGRREQVAGVAQQAVTYYEKLPSDSRSPETKRRQARALAHLGSALAAQAKYAEAAESTQRAVVILERLRRDGDDSDVTLVAMAEARLQATYGYWLTGNIPLALQTAEQTVALIEPRAAQSGVSFEVRRWHARALWRLGFCWVHAGSDTRALSYYERALAIQRDLSKKPEAGFELAIQTASTLMNLTNVLSRLTDHRTEIRMLLEEGAAAVERVLAEQPTNIRAMEALGRLQDNLGVFFVGELNARDALHWRQQAVATWERCNLLDPGQSDYQYNVHLSRSSARHIQAAQGQVATALAGWRADLAACTHLEGSVYSISNVGLQWRYLAFWLARSGDHQGAEDALAQQAVLWPRIRGNSTSEKATSHEDVDHDFTSAAETAFHLGDFATARTEAQAVLALIARRPEVPPQRTRWIERTARSVLAWVNLLSDDDAAAVAISAMDDPPSTHRYNVRSEFAELTTPRALALARLGRDNEARTLIEPAVAFFRETLAAQPAHCASLEELAWAIYVEAIAQPPAAGERRKTLLAEASVLVAAMTEEYRALSTVRRLREWIASEQAKAGAM